MKAAEGQAVFAVMEQVNGLVRQTGFHQRAEVGVRVVSAGEINSHLPPPPQAVARDADEHGAEEEEGGAGHWATASAGAGKKSSGLTAIPAAFAFSMTSP